LRLALWRRRAACQLRQLAQPADGGVPAGGAVGRSLWQLFARQIDVLRAR